MVFLAGNIMPALSQQSAGSLNGIYLNAADAEQDQLLFAFDAPDKTYRIKEHPWKAGYLKITMPDTVATVGRADYWGYRQDGKMYRLHRRFKYEVVAREGDLWIYTLRFSRNREYYFSRTASGQVLPLNRRKLRQAFEDDPQFVHLLALRPRKSLESQIPPGKRLTVIELYTHSLASRRLSMQ